LLLWLTHMADTILDIVIIMVWQDFDPTSVPQIRLYIQRN